MRALGAQAALRMTLVLRAGHECAMSPPDLRPQTLRFSVVHHPIAPHALGAPLHYHHNEDELSYVLTGRLGALLGDDVVTAEPGTWVFKPRHQWHTFWNAGETPCEIIEVISPAGFENYFREVADAWGDMTQFAHINQKYALEMRLESVPDLCRRFGLTFPAL